MAVYEQQTKLFIGNWTPAIVWVLSLAPC